jgi:hypothetical protein
MKMEYNLNFFLNNQNEYLTAEIFNHNKKMQEGFIKSRIIRGASNKVEQVMRTAHPICWCGCVPVGYIIFQSTIRTKFV